jgi:hypothetical protein
MHGIGDKYADIMRDGMPEPQRHEFNCDCGKTVFEADTLKCGQCGHVGCKKCMVKVLGIPFCGPGCRDAWYLDGIREEAAKIDAEEILDLIRDWEENG